MYDYPDSLALPAGNTTNLDHEIGAIDAQHTGASGFAMLAEGRAAFATRVHITSKAERSIDVQTYIWHADITGKYLAYELLRAADRGVRVRLLLDDMDARAKNDPLVALDSHENIEVRLFSPLASRRGIFGALGDFIRSFNRLNHRMHIKNWIVDNRVAIAGGRNVGDEYFAASDETNFADMELMMIGDVVRAGSKEFDQFWNSGVVYRIADLNPDLAQTTDLASLRSQLDQAAREASSSRYAEALRADPILPAIVSGHFDVHWDSNANLVADDPLKAQAEGALNKSHVLKTLMPRLVAAQNNIVIASPYFVPGNEGTELLVKLAKRGVAVMILTNSLAANDVAAVHGGYSKYRKQLLEGGVQLWELKPRGDEQADSSLLGSSGASLHAKSLSIDDSSVFVGSYNLDPRSTALNAEMGVFVHSAVLAQQLKAAFDAGTQSTSAWRVTLEDGELRWSDGTHSFSDEPSASWWRRFQAWLTRVLPVDPLL